MWITRREKKTLKSLVANLQVWCELLGSESPMSDQSHFEVFTQWCQSAHLIPFMLRCYRRCGVAGLADGQHMGSNKPGVNPLYPLVLPTVPDFCYGQAFHKVLQYWYGGTETIVRSIDDSKEVEAARQNLGLIPGQERLNNQCWFTVKKDVLGKEEQPVASSKSRAASKTFLSIFKSQGQGEESPLTKNTLSQLEAFVSSSKTAAAAGKVVKQQAPPSIGRSSTLLEEDKSRASALVVRKAPQAQAIRRPVAVPLGPGKLSASDPFFWFCHGDFSLYTYPANMVPRHYLNDATALDHMYADVVSRSGTPDISADAENEGFNTSLGKEVVPPSICICQPTELVARDRKRFPVHKTYADPEHLLLGDAGWFPGALGYRFSFEAKTDDVQRYVLLSSMPQASLVYIEHVKAPPKKSQKNSAKGAASTDDRKDASYIVDSSSDDDSEQSSADGDSGQGRSRLKPPFLRRRRRKNRVGTSMQKGREANVDVMLPPLLPCDQATIRLA